MDGIGKIIFNERERAGISKHELCAGICVVATLSRLEWREENVGKWHIDAFLQRLGRSQDKFWSIVHISDYEVMELRREIWNCILQGNYEKACKDIAVYKSEVATGNFHEQFLKKCEGMIAGRKNHDWEKALRLFSEALKATVPNFHIRKLENMLLGRDEIQIVLLMAEAYGHLKQKKKAEQMAEGLLHNIQNRKWDEEELVKIYPKVVSVYTDFLKEEDRYEEVISLAEHAAEMLIDNGIIFLLAELQEKVVWGMERRRVEEERRFSIREEQNYAQLRVHVAILNELWEEYGNLKKEDMLYCTNVQKDISVSNEIIGKCRRLCNLSQEKVSEEVCSVEQYSRIETGKCSPKEKSYRGLMEKMNQAQERNRFFINAQEYSMHEQVRQLEKYINGRELKRASVEWKKIKKKISDNTLNNKQCIARYDAIIKRYENKISIEEYIAELETALRITMPEFDVIDIKKWPLSRNEIILLSSIAGAYCEMGKGKDAKSIYDALWESVSESNTDKIYHVTKYKLLSYNMGLLEGIEENFTRAKEILDCGIRSCMSAGRFEMIASFLYCLGWVLREEGKEENKEKARYILEQAFHLGNMLKLPNLCNEICNYYEEEWKTEIIY